jgi:membrane protease YdiL (CAAX protease family)
MTSKQVRIFELVLVLATGFLPAIISSLAFIFTGHVKDYAKIGAVDYTIWIFQGILSIALMFYILFKNGRSYSDIGVSLIFRGKDLLIGIGLVFITGVLYAAINHIVSIFFPEFVTRAMNPQNLGFINAQYKGFLIIASFVIPLQEELLVRGFTMSEIFLLTENKILAIVISVGIQFSYHLYQGLEAAVLMSPYFILISVYFVKTGNLNPIIYSHILVDFVKTISLR